MSTTRYLIGFVDTGVEWQGKRAAAGFLGHRTVTLRAAVQLPHVRLEVHARDILGGGDAVRAQRLHHAVAIDVRLDLDDVDEPGPLVIGVICDERCHVDVGEQLRIALGCGTP